MPVIKTQMLVSQKHKKQLKSRVKLSAAPVPQGSWLEKISPSCLDLLIQNFTPQKIKEGFVGKLGRNKWKKNL